MTDEFLTLNKLKELLKKEGIKPNKILGQHFLIDRNVRDKIIDFAQLNPDDIVIEIGSGLGEITEGIAKQVKKVYGFEKDPHIADILKKRLAEKENVEIIIKDFLDMEESFFKNIAVNNNIKIIGNLPYYIASPILFNLLKFRNYWNLALVSLPQEVSKKIIAVSGEKDFGFMAVLFSLYTQTRICYKLGKTIFYPMPKVTSVFLSIKPLKTPSVFIPDEKMFWEIIPTLFLYKRKTIQNVLGKTWKINKNDLKTILEKSDINPLLRSHQLNLDQMIKLVNTYKPLTTKNKNIIIHNK
ncbi:MAG: 16S rRNA (adenine(1518)-N(6)/adenine(1519)-N(6))-dimethyltransferase RsmA [Candidatus Omnitrophica bacterium]|jgi:16S rRNA (adenine1518-N6/adenine1519-N6)-dimethyltransferase|nr:16S rRNA (adenine(1518)-N(6)/adenine(1519)-N(6))-dimethyltransferase RsmA [Candidatus Omnitrophota bacterium]